MEVGSELLWKASSAILLCFLVARLVSLLLSFSTPPATCTDEVREKGYKRIATVDLEHDHDHGGHKKQQKSPVHGGGGERLSKIRSSGGSKKKKKRVNFLDQAAKVVDFVKEIEVNGGFEDVGSSGDVGQQSLDQKKKRENLVGFEGVERGERISDGKVEQQEEEISSNVKIGDDDLGMLSDEEGWEGIERSDLEREFGRARDFVELGEKEGRFSMAGNDVIMQLYGLQKVAMEGPCHEPQPMALKLSARAKWNAWQRLGNMSPEQAMEKYISLLSDIVPGWMDSHSSVEMEKSSKEEVDSLLDANINARLAHHSTSASERTSELSDLTDISTAVNKGKE